MSGIDDIEQRLAAVEAEVTRLREQVTDTHTLAAHADRDVAEFRAELRAQTRLISALRETQVEQVAELAGLRTETLARFGQVQDGLGYITRLLEGLAADR